LRREIESKSEDISSIAKRNHTHPEKLRRAYRENISDYRMFYDKHEKMFTEEAFVFPKNISANMGIDETSLVDGEFYTILYNKEKHGKKGSLAAIIKGTKAEVVTGAIDKYAGVMPQFGIQEISLDLSNGMDWIARHIAPNAMKTYDRFHVESLVCEAVQSVRVKYRWEAIEKENELRKQKGKKEIHRIKTYSNGDTERQLLARSRSLLYKAHYKWSPQQKERAAILFEEFPSIKKAYNFYMEFKRGYQMNQLQAKFHFEEWIKKVKKSGLNELSIVARTIDSRLGGILNYLINRTTNAAVENFNGKLKSFLSRVKGVNDKDIFFYRLIQLYA
jgi:transposase